MWNGGTAGDAYLVHLTSTAFDSVDLHDGRSAEPVRDPGRRVERAHDERRGDDR